MLAELINIPTLHNSHILLFKVEQTRHPFPQLVHTPFNNVRPGMHFLHTSDPDDKLHRLHLSGQRIQFPFKLRVAPSIHSMQVELLV